MDANVKKEERISRLISALPSNVRIAFQRHRSCGTMAAKGNI
jgi:hypothetical protein